jgi:threonine/homoserine/homoserine lactone efflux protein
MGVLPGFFDLRSITTIDIVIILSISAAVPFIGNLVLAGCVGKIRGLLSSPTLLKKLNIGSGALLILVGLVIGVL